MRSNLLFAAFAAALVCAASIAQAQPQPPQGLGGGPQQAEPTIEARIGPLFSAPLGDDHLFGDWGGARTWLSDHGIDLRFNYLSESAGNITGGKAKGYEYADQLALEIDLDFGKIADLPGFWIHSMIVQRHGRSLSADELRDDLDAVQEIYGGGGNVFAHLVYLYGEWATNNDRVDIAAGWLPVGTYFGASPLYCDFMNVIICGNPHPLPNYPGEPDWPAATWGGQVRYLPTPQTYVMAGLFQVQPTEGGQSGWNLSWKGTTGASIPAEIGWVPYFGPNRLVGHYKFGFDEDTSGYPDLFLDQNGDPLVASGLPGARRAGRRMYYVMLDQMLIRTGKDETSGLIAFGGWIHADQDVSGLANHFFAGFTDTADAIGRPQDTFGFNWNWFAVSSALTRTQELEQALGLPLTGGGLGPAYAIQTTEQTLELMYTAQVYTGVALMPDLQYIIHPGGTTANRNSLVLGLRTNVLF